MTRSDNPFEDLPEWKERRRLEEAQAAAEQGSYGQPHDGGFAGDNSDLYPGGAPAAPEPGYQQDYDGYGGRPASDQQYGVGGHDSYGEPSMAEFPAERYAPASAGGYDYGAPDHGGYGGDPNLAAPGYPGLAPQHQGDAGMLGNFGAGGASSYDTDQYAADGYDAGSYDQGKPGAAPMYYDPASGYEQGGGDQWAMAPVGTGSHDAYGPEDEGDDEYEYEEEGQRYSWKLLAAVVVTGAVVTGGGVVLYNSVTDGGLGAGGSAPIIRAEQGPAKTAPRDVGGRQFANRDSKLLGRLDSGAGSARSRALTTEGGNRVRSVPTIKIGRNGQAILPANTAPESQSAVAPQRAEAAPVAPGINVVDSFNGRSSLSGLPSGLRGAVTGGDVASATQAVSNAARTVSTAALPRAEPPASVPTAPAPVAQERSLRNLATARSNAAPPVPTWSSWKSGNRAPARQNVVAARPTPARPTNTVRAPRTTASTLGATSVAGGKGYVAVLATKPTRIKALQSFAEIQQRHPTALQNRVPNVQMADLKARGLGIMYRLVVGPAASRSAANSVCAALKSEGYQGCWVKPN